MRLRGRTDGAGCLTQSRRQRLAGPSTREIAAADTGTDTRASQRLTRRSRHDTPRPLTDDGSRDGTHQWKSTRGGRARAGPHPNGPRAAQRARDRGAPRGHWAFPPAQRRRPARRPAAGSALPSADRDRPSRPTPPGRRNAPRGSRGPPAPRLRSPSARSPRRPPPAAPLPSPPAAGGAARKAGPIPAPRRPHGAARPRGARSQPSARPSAPRLPPLGGSGAAHRRRALSPAGREERERSSRPRRQWLPRSYERPATPRAPNGCCATADVRLQVPACRAAGRAPAPCCAALPAGAAGCRADGGRAARGPRGERGGCGAGRVCWCPRTGPIVAFRRCGSWQVTMQGARWALLCPSLQRNSLNSRHPDAARCVCLPLWLR